MSRKKNLVTLVVDPDPDFTEQLKADPKTALYPMVIARSGKEAQSLLADTSRAFCGIFVSPDIEGSRIGEPGSLSVIRFAHQLRPATPLLLICKGAPPFDDKEMRRLGILDNLTKPLTYTKMMANLAPAAFVFDADEALAKKSQDETNEEVAADDSTFMPIRADHFLSGSRCLFDLYVRLATGRYVKILNAGDSFSNDRLERYLEKGVTHFHLKKEAQEFYLSYCDQLASAVLRRRDLPVESKTSVVLNHGEEVMNYLRANGVSETNLLYAATFVENVHELVKQMSPEKEPLFRGFLGDLVAFEHGVATAMIAAILTRPLGIHADKLVNVVGLAGFLHDIGLARTGLFQTSDVLVNEDEELMSDEERAIYRTHPTIGAEILKDVRGVDPAVVQAVAQHHERVNKRGFPLGLGAGQIGQVTEIVGLSDEFVRLLNRSQRTPNVNPFYEMERIAAQGFSSTVALAFRKVFLP